MPSLLRCARENKHAGNKPEGGLRVIETASVFAEWSEGASKGKHLENRNLALLVESASGDGQEAVRTLRHEEVDAEVQRVVDAARRDLGAELRG